MSLGTADPAATSVEDVLASIWQRVSGRGPVGHDDDLFALGGTWFDTARACSLVRAALDVELTPSELAGAPTPDGLAALVERRRPAGGVDAGGAGVAPVAVSQEGMLWHEQLAPGSFNLAPFVRRLRGPLDHEALGAAFEELMRRHEPLRTSLRVREGRAVQVVGDTPAVRLPVTDLTGSAPAAAEDQARSMIAEAANSPFDLAADPPFQPWLIRFGPDDHLLVVRLHHTVFDDWSLGVYRRELSAAYAAFAGGEAPSLPPLPVGFSEYARRQHRRLAGPPGTAELTWWRQQLSGAPWTTQVAVGDPSGKPPSGPSFPVSLTLDPELVRRLRALASHGRATLFMTLLAGFQVLLHRRTGQDDLLIASVVAGRGERDVEGLIGCFTKKVPLRLRLDGDPTFLELLARVREGLLGALAHQNLGFETVLQETLGHRAARHGVVPHLPIMFQGLVPPRTQLDLPGLSGSGFGSADTQGPGMHVVAREAADEPAPAWGEGLYPGTFLGLSVVDDGENVTLLAQGGFHRPAVEALLGEFRTLLADIVAAPLGKVADLLGAGFGAAPTEGFRGFRLDRPRLEEAVTRCAEARQASLTEYGGRAADTGHSGRAAETEDGSRATEPEHGDRAAEPELAARVVTEPVRAPSLRQLRTCLWSRLPGSIWPAELVVASGSTDVPGELGDPGEHERLLASAWAEVLGVPEVGGDANYWQDFSFLEALAKAKEAGAAVTPEQVARNRTIATLAADLDTSPRPAAGASHPPGPVGPAGGTASEVIRAEGLSKSYPGGPTAVDALDLSAREGEVFGLLGPNGAGKTTTVGMLTTLVAPTAGRAFVGGVDVVADPALAKQYLGVVPQANNLDNDLTVFENLYFHGRYFGMSGKTARAAADGMLERFRLAGRGRDKVEHLSGGMVRRLQLARALMHGPAVAFLDEPTAGLDPQSRLALWDIVAGLRAEGQTVLLTTHSMEEAERFCDRVAIMDHGRILALDTPERLKRTYGVAGAMLVHGDGDLDGFARALRPLEWVHEAEMAEGGVRIRMAGGDGTASAVMALAERVGVKITNLAVSEDSLEAVFINLTGRELRE